MGWTCSSVGKGSRNEYKISVGMPLGRQRRTQENAFKVYLRETDSEYGRWFELTQNRVL